MSLNAAPSAAPPSGGAPYIHPSRLAAPALRKADQRAKARSSTGAITAAPKTKAKERYLKAKKERKKKKKATAAPKAPGQGKGKLLKDVEIEGLERANGDEAVERVRRLREKREKRELREEGRSKKKEVKAAKVKQAEEMPKLQPPQIISTTPDTLKVTGSNGSSSVPNDSNAHHPVGDDDSSGDDGSASSSSASSPPATPDHVDADNLQPAKSSSSGDENGDDDQMDTDPDHEEDGPALSRFPRAQRKLKSDPRLLSTQGLPEGLVHPVVVDPSVRRAIDGDDTPDDAAESKTDAVLRLVSPAMIRRLEKLGITEWFAVQTTVIPLLLVHDNSPLYPSPQPDLCVSAPTGSGKTLAYAVPIIERLRPRVIRQLRALVILPTRDLVAQVRETMQSLAKGSGLAIGSVAGQQSFAHEQGQLIDSEGSRLDVLIATPGRLMDHLSSTPAFHLHHLRYLVVDEADRLLNQSFQEWLPKLMDALDPTKAATKRNDEDDEIDFDIPAAKEGDETLPVNLEAPAWAQHKDRKNGILTDLDEPRAPSVQKLLFSATLTRDPSHIAALGLRDPRYVSVQDTQEDGRVGFQQTTLPASLREHMLITPTSLKPLYLLHLLHAPTTPILQALCFTKSVDSSARLVKLIEFFEEEWANGRKERARVRSLEESDAEETHAERRIRVRDFSSDLTPAQRGRILSEFKAGQIDLLVCSDLMARGMDLPHVSHVISYDAPVDLTKYVHRVGRTARAGRTGEAWSLVEEQEARYFKRMHAKAGREGKIKKEKLPREKEMDVFKPAYEAALEKLGKVYNQRSRET